MSKVLFIPLQLSLGTALCLFASPLLAQISSDGTVNTQVNQNGSVAEITGGETRGSNLFHSFQEFSVQTGNEAFFNNDQNISNIFSRVTGGNISNINGVIRAKGDANLFLINPAGIIFGRNARLDIGGSFYGSTASSILFEGGKFSAFDLENPPLLTVNAPIGLGFRDNPGDIINTSIGVNPDGQINVTGGSVGLQVPLGETLAIIGGNVLLNDGNLTAKGGHIEIGSILSEGEVGLVETDIGLIFNYDTINSFGDIELNNTSVVDVTASGGGSINVNGRNVLIDSSVLHGGILATSNSPNAQAGNINVNTNSLALNNFGDIRNSTAGIGNAGDIIIDAQEISLQNSSLIVTEVSDEGEGGIGDAGDIDINTNSLFVRNASGILADVENQGNAGNITIDASNSIVLEGEGVARGDSSILVPSQISATTDPIELDVSGEAGAIVISTDSLNLNDGGFIRTSTLGLGDAGDVVIDADNIILNGFSSQGRGSFIASDVALEAEGNGGNVTLQSDILSLINGGEISVSTLGQGEGGNLKINANNLELNGGEDGIFTVIAAQVGREATGTGGSITIGSQESPVEQLRLTNGSQILVNTFNQGDAGNLSIFSKNIEISGQGTFTSSLSASVETDATGMGGNITLETENLLLTNGGQISASTFGQGDGGEIKIDANSIELNGGEEGIFTSIAAQVGREATGTGGNITIGSQESPAEQLRLTNGSQILVNTFGQGNTVGQGDAGNLSIFSKNIEISGQGTFPSSLSASVEIGATGMGGNITLKTENLLLTNGGQISASTSGQGDGGEIKIDANSIELNGGEEGILTFIFAQVEPGANGSSGNIFIDTQKLNLTNGGQISASTFSKGDGGEIKINANEIEIFEAPTGAATGLSALSFDGAEGVGGSILLDLDNLTLDSGLISSTTSFGQGGNVNLSIAENLIMRNNSSISAQALGDAIGGNIDINAQFVIAFPNGNSNILANANQGRGGNININAESLFGIEERTPNNSTNDIDASSQVRGLDGTVNINTPDINPVQGVTELPTDVVAPEQTTQQACEANREAIAQGGLNITGKGGITPDPGEPLEALNVYVAGESGSAQNIPAPVETAQGKIQPARGVIITESGEVILTPYRTANTGERIPETRNCG